MSPSPTRALATNWAAHIAAMTLKEEEFTVAEPAQSKPEVFPGILAHAHFTEFSRFPLHTALAWKKRWVGRGRKLGQPVYVDYHGQSSDEEDTRAELKHQVCPRAWLSHAPLLPASPGNTLHAPLLPIPFLLVHCYSSFLPFLHAARRQPLCPAGVDRAHQEAVHCPRGKARGAASEGLFIDEGT